MKIQSQFRWLITLIILLNNILAGFPQKVEMSSNTLSNQHINAFVEDKWGYMWVATGRGLCQYNGYEYKYYYSALGDSKSLPSDFVTNLFVDSDAQLWVSTTNGLCKYDYDRKNFVSYIYADSIWKACDMGIMEFKGKRFSYGVNGVKEIDEKNKKLFIVGQTEDLLVSTVALDNSSKMWLGCRGGQGILCYDERFSLLKKIPVHKSIEIYCSYKHTDGMIWFGSTQGIIVVNPDKMEIIHTPINETYQSLLSKLYVTFISPIGNNLLIGTENSGLYIYNSETDQLLTGAMTNYFTENTSKHVTCCYEDKSENLWLGTFEQGYQLDLNPHKKINQDRFLNSYINGKFVTRIVVDRSGNFWIGTRYNGLIYYNRKTHEISEYNSSNFKPFSSSNSNFVQSLYLDSNGNLWLEYDKKLIHCITEQNNKISSYKVYNVRTDIVTIVEDNQKRIWTGSASDGIFIFDINSKEEPIILPLPKKEWNNITKLIQTRSGEMMYASYDDGVYTVDPNTLQITPLCDNPEIDYYIDRTIFLYEDFDDNIWLGTYGKGLIKYTPKAKQYIVYSMNDGLPSNDILAITSDAEENLWMSTSFGLSKFDIKKKRFFSFFDYDGIGGNQFHEKSIAKADDGTILFGGNHGLSYFNPHDVKIRSTAVPIIFEDLKILNISEEVGGDSGILKQNINETEEITLNHFQNVFSIDYVGIDFGTSRKIRYAYKLDGFDKDWNYVGEYRRATYSNLSPGTYTLLVKAQSEDGTWNNESKELIIHIQAAPWLSIPAFFMYFLIIVAIVYFLNRMYIRLKIDKEKILLIEKERSQEKAMIDMKIRFFTNISHELRTPLSMIYGPVKALLDLNNIPENSHYLLQLMNHNVDRLFRLINQLLDFGKLESDTISLSIANSDVCSIIHGLVNNYSYYAQGKGVEVVVNCPYDSLILPVDAEKLNHILSNILSNALKYTLNDGKVVIDVMVKDKPELEGGFSEKLHGKKCLVIRVTDNGIGMPEEDLDFLFERYRRFHDKNNSSNSIAGTGIGLNYIKRLLEKHKGEITAKLGEEKGMVFSFAIPIELSMYSEEEIKENVAPSFSTLPLKGIYQEVDELEDAVLNNVEEDKYTILIVEDNAELCIFMRGLLKSHYHVDVASNGQEGYEKAIEIIPDIIISDVLMPIMNGYELCKNIKNDINLCHIPFVILTAKTIEDDLIEGYSNGADVYLSKPFNPKLLITIINNIFTNIKRRNQLTLGHLMAEKEDQELPEQLEMNPLDERFIQKIYACIEKDISNTELNVNMLGRDLGMSRTSFYRKIKALTGQSPNDFLRIFRLKQAAELILRKEFSINEVGDMTGFRTHSHFSTCFKKYYGVSPKEYKK